MDRQRGERIHGPYQHGNRWRLIIDRANGERAVASYATQGEAEREAAKAREALEGRTVSIAVKAHLKDMTERGLKATTISRAEYHLEKILALAVNGNRPIRWVVRHAAELYKATRAGAAVDTHRNALAAAKAWAGWCVEQGWLPVNPFKTVKGVGRRKRGKAQLRMTEAAKLTDVCLREWSPAAAATLCAFLLTMRADEVASRRVRDLDDDGRLMWVPAAKTEAGKRTLEVPLVLQPLLRELAANRDAEAPLFGGPTNEERTRYWTYYHVQRLCKAAGVPVISPHGLRGTHSTIADEAGVTGHVIAAAMGHASPAITRAAYIDGDRARSAKARRVIERLGAGKFLPDSTNQSDDDQT